MIISLRQEIKVAVVVVRRLSGLLWCCLCYECRNCWNQNLAYCATFWNSRTLGRWSAPCWTWTNRSLSFFCWKNGPRNDFCYIVLSCRGSAASQTQDVRCQSDKINMTPLFHISHGCACHLCVTKNSRLCSGTVGWATGRAYGL